MTIDRAVKHLKWKLENKWKATEDDEKSINSIMDFVENKHKEQLNNYQLYAKLYVFVLGELLQYYQCSVFDKTAQVELHKIIDKPLEDIISEFRTKANDVERNLKMKSAGMVLKHPATLSKEEKETNNSLLTSEMIKDEMTPEEAINNLESMINLSINKYG